jgi:hypothetical protein
MWVDHISDDSGHGPIVVLKRRKSLDAGGEVGDALGQIGFYGEDENGGSSTQYGQINTKIIDPADGNEAGALNFEIMHHGGGRNVIRASGHGTSTGSLVINDEAVDIDFRVEGETNPNLIYVDASQNKVGIGTAIPNAMLEVDGEARLSDATDMGSNDASLATKKYVDDKTSHTKTITIESPTNSEDITIFRTYEAITVQEVWAVRTGSGATNFRLRHSTNRAAAGTLVTNNLNSNSGSVGNIAPLSDSTIPANSWIWLETTGASGTNVTFTVDLRYTVD